VGVITIDDAMTVLDEEHEEDILRLAGVGEGALSDPVWATARQRIPWLLVNLLTAGLAALVIAQFEGTIEALVALAILMPIVASMGGNAGTQSLTVAVRALATRDLTRSNAGRVIRREALVGLLNGGALAVLLGGGTALLFGSPELGGVIATALIVNLFVASLAGVFVPLFLSGSEWTRPGVGDLRDHGDGRGGFFAFLGLADAGAAVTDPDGDQGRGPRPRLCAPQAGLERGHPDPSALLRRSWRSTRTAALRLPADRTEIDTAAGDGTGRRARARGVPSTPSGEIPCRSGNGRPHARWPTVASAP
jgi:hypothetical protein